VWPWNFVFFYAANDLILQEIVNLSELTEQIDTLRDNMSFIQDNISECQNSIVHMEEFKVKRLFLSSLVFRLILHKLINKTTEWQTVIVICDWSGCSHMHVYINE